MLKRSAVQRLRKDRLATALMEELEGRTLFGVGSTPLPTIGMLESPNNTVVRLQTNLGDVDLELFNSVAPGTVTNFLRYVQEGHYDQSFFHRAVSNFVLQGGGFRFDDATTPAFHAVPTYAAITNEFSRSNTARTIAMAKLGGNPDSATNQWFVNLADNGSNLDNQNGGFTVFGRVLGDASWAVIQSIMALPISNLSATPQFTGPFAGNFGTTPTTTAFGGGNVTEGLLVRINDAEVIKPANVGAFYTTQLYYPEGFTGSTISEFLPLGNPGNSTVHYQVIVRAELSTGDISATGGWFRDRVISTGSINAQSRGGITISQFGPGGAPGANDLVPQGVPYAIEVWATGDIAANLSHYDFGTSTGESFTPVTDTTWGFGEGTKLNGSVFDFLVWDNPNKTDANITITFYFQSSNPVTLNVTTDAFRRGGLAFQNVTQLTNNTVFSMRMTADVPIVAALSHFDNRGDQSGSSSLGVPGTASSVGILPFGQGGSAIDHMQVSFLNPGSTPTVVTMVLRFENTAQEITVSPTLVIPGNRRASFDLDTLLNGRVVAGDPFSIRYTTSPSSTPVYAHASVVALGDAVSNPFATNVANAFLFAEGFMDPGRAGDSVLETISVYNPNSVFFTGQNTTANITFQFMYGDGFVVTHTAQVLGGARLDLTLDEFQPILTQGTQNGRFFYSIRVSSDIPMMAEMLHYDLTLGGLQASGGFSTLGTPQGTVLRLDQL